MKIYEKVVIDMRSGEVLEEVSFDYYGPLCEIKGGGGGGSTSGRVNYPQYMTDIHKEWMDNSGDDLVSAGNSITALIDVGVDNSPYSGELAYDLDSDITTFLAALTTFDSEVDAISPTTDWATYLTSANTQVDDTLVDNASSAHGDILDDRLTTDVLPRFQTGMRDINAVISSSFTIGQSILEAFNTRDVAAFDAKLRVQQIQWKLEGVKDIINLLQLKMHYRDSVTRATVESYRIKAVLKKEELEEQLDIDDKDYRWGPELWQYGSNVMSSISGSAVSTHRGPTKAPSSALGGAMGGALSGAAMGASTGNPIVAGVGAIIGGIAGALT